MKSPLGWLPRPGEYRDVPGGVLWCESLDLHRNFATDIVTGEICLKFQVSLEEYEKAKAEYELSKQQRQLAGQAPLQISDSDG